MTVAAGMLGGPEGGHYPATPGTIVYPLEGSGVRKIDLVRPRGVGFRV